MRATGSAHPAIQRCSTKPFSTWAMQSLAIPLFPWRMPPFPLYAQLATLNLIPRAYGWKRPSFIAVARLNWIRICPKGTSPALFFYGGPSKNFQHLEAIAELKRALALQSNQPQAYNRLGTILAHIGLLDHAREMYERGRPFHPRKAVSHSIVQVYVWNREYDLAREEIQAWRAENPDNKYPVSLGRSRP